MRSQPLSIDAPAIRLNATNEDCTSLGMNPEEAFFLTGMIIFHVEERKEIAGTESHGRGATNYGDSIIESTYPQ
jgi:hypothetical protein